MQDGGPHGLAVEMGSRRSFHITDNRFFLPDRGSNPRANSNGPRARRQRATAKSLSAASSSDDSGKVFLRLQATAEESLSHWLTVYSMG